MRQRVTLEVAPALPAEGSGDHVTLGADPAVADRMPILMEREFPELASPSPGDLQEAQVAVVRSLVEDSSVSP